MQSLRNKSEADEIIRRIHTLTPQSANKWGKMNAAQMLAHSCLALEMAVGGRQFHYPFLFKVIGKLFIKKTILNKEPYKPNLPTGKDFIIRDERNFEKEKENLITLLQKYSSVDDDYLNSKIHPLIGKISPSEWDWMQYKHIDHHLKSFGV